MKKSLQLDVRYGRIESRNRMARARMWLIWHRKLMAVPSEFHPSEFHIIHLFRAARAYSRGIYASYMQPYKLNDLFFFFFVFLTLFFIFLVETLRRRNGDSIRNIRLILSPFSLQFQGGCTHTHTHTQLGRMKVKRYQVTVRMWW